MPVRTVIEHGTKDKRSVAFALDWPGWSRGAKTAEDALETLEAYRERYRPVAELAGMAPSSTPPVRSRSSRIASAPARPTSGASPSRRPRPSRARWTRRSSNASSRSCGPPGRSSTASRRGSRPRCAKGLVAADASATGSSATSSASRAWTSRRASGSGPRRQGALIPDGIRGYREAYVAAMRDYNDGKVEQAHAIEDPAIPDPPLGLPHARPRVGDGGQGPFPGRGVT